MKQIAAALIKAQQEMGNAKKDSSNPYYKSKYADLNSVREACIPSLNSNNIAVLQPIVQVDGKNYIKTMLLHESGETIEGLTEIIFAKQNDAQAQGSGITYARRYGLQSLICIGAEDDDGNKASEESKERKQLKAAAQSVDEDMKETQRKANEDNFAKIKGELEEAESLEELAKIWEDNKKQINALRKYAANLFSMLEECKDACKSDLQEAQRIAKELGDIVE